MPTLAAFALLAVSAAPGPAGAPGAAEVALETLPTRVEVRTAEGFIRAEGPDPGGAPGAFGTYHPAARAAGGGATAGVAGADGREAEAIAPAPASRQAGRDPCRSERDRYLRRLLGMAGIELERPAALLGGLAGPGGYAGEYLFTAYGLLAGVEPLRPLAWDSELQRDAEELAACDEGAPGRR